MKLGESKEDYLEAMYILKRQKGYVRNFLLCNYLIILLLKPFPSYMRCQNDIIHSIKRTVFFRWFGFSRLLWLQI